MIYRIFESEHPQVRIAEIQDANFPLITKGDKIPLSVNGKDSLYIVKKVGSLNWSADNKLVIDIWAEDYFAKSK